MKIEHEHAHKLLGQILAALTLTAGVSAQHLAHPSGAGNLANDIREGRAPRRVSDPADGGTMQVDLAQAPELEVSFEVIGTLDEGVLGALIPLRADLRSRLSLSGGIPGAIALLEVELAGPTRSGGGRIALARGVFGPTGIFEVELPAGVEYAGLAARGSMIDGRVVTETVAVELEPAAEEAFLSWQVLAKLPRPRGAHHGGSFRRVRPGYVDPRPLR